MFNVSDAPIDLHYTWHDLGIPSGSHVVHDLWSHKELGGTDQIKVTLAPHASALYRVE
jgi:hypothetical protein